jgi:hypothetical protein
VSGSGGLEAASNEEHPEPLQRLRVFGHRSPSQVASEGGGSSIVVGGCLSTPGRVPQRGDDGRRDSLGPQLRLERDSPSRGVAVPLLNPPAREGLVINETDPFEALERGRDNIFGGVRPAKTLLDLPP